jgi:predicted Zn-dependent protease
MATSMLCLSSSDRRYLEAAQGWFALGNLTEATAELEKIDPQARAHPDVLEIRTAIFLSAKQWSSAWEVADALVRMAPDRLYGWLSRSEALHGLGRTHQAGRQLALALGTPIPSEDKSRFLRC